MSEETRKAERRYYFDRHTPEYRLEFEQVTQEMVSRCRPSKGLDEHRAGPR
jgi:hypothetical protein